MIAIEHQFQCSMCGSDKSSTHTTNSIDADDPHVTIQTQYRTCDMCDHQAVEWTAYTTTHSSLTSVNIDAAPPIKLTLF